MRILPESLLGSVGLEGYAMPIAGRPFGHVLLDISAARDDLAFEPEPFETWMATTARGCAADLRGRIQQATPPARPDRGGAQLSHGYRAGPAAPYRQPRKSLNAAPQHE